MKKYISLALSLLMCVSLLASCGSSSSGSSGSSGTSAPADDNFTITLKLGYAGTNDQAAPGHMVIWSDAVKEATDGRIIIETYPAGQLGTGVEMIEAVDIGTLDMTLGDYSLLETYLPEISLLSLPCMVADYDHMWEIYDGEVGAELNSRLEANSNLKLLDSMYNGFRYIASVRSLESLDDCKGLIIRSPESDIYVNTFKLFGMSPTPLPLGDVYSALQTGVVEAVDSPVANFVSMGFAEVAPYILMSRHLSSVLPVIINQNVWASIPAADQEILLSTLADCVEDSNEAVLAEEDAMFAQLEANGAIFCELNDADYAALIENCTAYWSEFADKHSCQDILDLVLKTL